ncbi:MAG: hypothetical protein A3K45_07790 [Chloroflexi bacterium RIFOXYC12_FULL_59_14]|nr:MAG: hypothetical protein A3K45_07790 [Chloroflexi bacterium RIFOXYC12_FULL_59_14]
MNDDLAINETTVADLLKKAPEAVRFFINQQTACVGCYLAKFCTLKDVVNAYQLEEKTFLQELAKFTVKKS